MNKKPIIVAVLLTIFVLITGYLGYVFYQEIATLNAISTFLSNQNGAFDQAVYTSSVRINQAIQNQIMASSTKK